MTFIAPAQFTRATPGLVVSTASVGATSVITVRGEADFATLPALTFVLNRVVVDHDGAVVVDLDQTDFIDSAVVRAIVETSEVLHERGRRLTFRSPSRLAVLMIGISGFVDLALEEASGPDHPADRDLSHA